MLLGLILLYFAGKAFYDLAAEHRRSKWLFAILGIVSYYAGLYFGAFLIGIGYALLYREIPDNGNEMVLGLLAIPIGVLVCWGFYKILERQWSKTSERFVADENETIDADLSQKEN